MFTPTRDEARRFLFDAWRKHRAGLPASPLERQAAGLIAIHPEYHAMLDAPEQHLDRDYVPEGGAVNPFLHLSLHLAVAEQIASTSRREYARSSSGCKARAAMRTRRCTRSSNAWAKWCGRLSARTARPTARCTSNASRVSGDASRLAEAVPPVAGQASARPDEVQ